MSRVGFGVEKLLRIYKENSDSEFIDLLFGSGVPGETRANRMRHR